MIRDLSGKTDINAAKIFEQVEDFIRRVHDMDIVIDQKAEAATFPDQQGKHFSLAGELAVSMAEYERKSADYLVAKRASEQIIDLPKDASPYVIAMAKENKRLKEQRLSQEYELKLFASEKCLVWINRAFTLGAIKETQSLSGKLRECVKRRIELEKQLYEAQQRLQELQRDNDGLRRLLGPRGQTFTGDVEEGRE